MSSLLDILDFYRQQQAQLNAQSCEAMNLARQQAAEFLTTAALPTKRVERYKYTAVDQLFAPDFQLALPQRDNTQPLRLCACTIPEMQALTVHVVNGQVVQLPSPDALPEGLRFMTISQAAATAPEWLATYYNKAAQQEPANAHKHTDRVERDVLTQLNTLLTSDGIVVHLSRGTKLQQPLQVVFNTLSEQPLMTHRRVLVVAEEDSECTLLVCEHAEGTAQYLTTQVTEVFAAPRAAVYLYTLEETRTDNTRFCNVYIEQAEESRVLTANIALTTGVSRTMTNARLLGTGADCQTLGAVVADGAQHVDNNLFVDHVAPNCTSDMLFKYVLDGRSRGVFAGKVMVRPDAQLTLSHQASNNLLVSPDAKVHSLPMLEIYADDVRCNHGSTIGRLDDTALLYLRQRGIPEKEARLLLQHAFINDVLQRVHIDSLRERLSLLVEKRFRGELRHCQDCPSVENQSEGSHASCSCQH